MSPAFQYITGAASILPVCDCHTLLEIHFSPRNTHFWLPSASFFLHIQYKHLTETLVSTNQYLDSFSFSSLLVEKPDSLLRRRSVEAKVSLVGCEAQLPLAMDECELL